MTTRASAKYKVSKRAIALIRFQRDMRVGNLFALADAMRMDPRDLVEEIVEEDDE